jgi:hypothetical protein
VARREANHVYSERMWAREEDIPSVLESLRGDDEEEDEDREEVKFPRLVTSSVSKRGSPSVRAS